MKEHDISEIVQRDEMVDLATEISALVNITMLLKDILTDESMMMVNEKLEERTERMEELICQKEKTL